MKPRELSRAVIDGARSVAKEAGVRAVFLNADLLPDPTQLTGLFGETEVVLFTRKRRQAIELEGLTEKIIRLPPVNLKRIEQIKLAALLALSKGYLRPGDLILFLSGIQHLGALDTMVVMEVGEEFEIFSLEEGASFVKVVKPEVFAKVVDLAVELGQEGREGKPVGGLFVLGDTETVMRYADQLVLNPFQGYPEERRNILDPHIMESVKEFCAIDGAFIIRSDGVIVTAGAFLRPLVPGEDLPQGLGARHAVAASMSASTDAVLVTLSESNGTVRIFKGGRMVTEIERGPKKRGGK
ncbi:MAG: DNA integrity scanning protein DisA nucleotide-binding domain protein [Candidatus Methylomirabilales bacterium]